MQKYPQNLPEYKHKVLKTKQISTQNSTWVFSQSLFSQSLSQNKKKQQNNSDQFSACFTPKLHSVQSKPVQSTNPVQVLSVDRAGVWKITNFPKQLNSMGYKVASRGIFKRI